MATLNMCAMDIIAFEKLLVDRNIRTNIELAERCGIDRNTAGKIRKGEELPSALVMYKLVDGLEMSPTQAGNIFFAQSLRTT